MHKSWLFRWICLVVGVLPRWRGIQGLSSPSPVLFERFRVVCPADASCAQNYNPTRNIPAESKDDDDWIWAAVYRSNNNQPSVLLRDDLLQSMQLAIDLAQTPDDNTLATSSNNDNESTNLIETPLSLAQQKPVAIACLRPSLDFPGCLVLDHLQCVLKKEETNDQCDGGSEHTEALSAAMDSLLAHYLEHDTGETGESSSSSSSPTPPPPRFHGAIRTKGTLVSGILLEARGFVPVQSLSRDMATHVSSYDDCLQAYAQRVLTMQGEARRRALSIVSSLSRLDRTADLEAAQSLSSNDNDDTDKNGEDDSYDPWANVNRML